jgi:uncharacterized protein
MTTMQKNCPNDGVPLMEMVKNGVTIDVCPECKGVWLDRGELEKLINVALEMEREYNAPRQPEQRQPDPRVQQPPQYGSPQHGTQYGGSYERPRDYDDRSREYRSTKDSDEWYDSRDGRDPRKKKSALGRIFDIFD